MCHAIIYNGQRKLSAVRFSSLVLNKAGSNQAWGRLTFLPCQPYGMEREHPTLVKVGFIGSLKQFIPFPHVYKV